MAKYVADYKGVWIEGAFCQPSWLKGASMAEKEAFAKRIARDAKAMDTKDLAEKHGVSKHVAKRIYRAVNKGNRHPRRYTPALMAKVRRLYSKGMPLKTIAKVTGVERRTGARIIRKAGLDKDPEIAKRRIEFMRKRLIDFGYSEEAAKRRAITFQHDHSQRTLPKERGQRKGK